MTKHLISFNEKGQEKRIVLPNTGFFQVCKGSVNNFLVRLDVGEIGQAEISVMEDHAIETHHNFIPGNGMVFTYGSIPK